jgi:signal transduction histidine kinase
MAKEKPVVADIPILHSRIATLEQLIEVYENSVVEQADKLYGEIAERRRAEEEIGRLNAELRQRIVQLHGAQNELVRKEKLAILGQLSGSVGHELRNPLGVMSNAVYFLKMVLAEADETVQQYLNIIKHEIDTSLRIITDLLDFARTRAPQIQGVTARALINGSVRRCIIPENLTFKTEIPDNLPPLGLDPLQIEQVLQNLITNGIQAMPGGGTMRIRAGFPEASTEQPPRHDHVEISVADTGEGISPENMKNLFQPLFTTKANGIGLGLVVCKNLVEANGGRIAVSSEPGKETVFTISLPIGG